MSLDNAKLMNKSEKYICTENVYEVKVISDLYEEKKFNDVTLVAANAETKVKAHRLILSASSEYFFAMFRASMKEANDPEVKFDQIDGQTLKMVIGFIYSNSIELDSDTVENVLKAAHLFQLKRLEDICCDYLTKQLDSNNCLGIALFARQHNYATFWESSFAFALQHFMELRKHDEFFMLNMEQLSELLCSDNLRVPSEEEVFRSIMLWIEHDQENRMKFLNDLIHRVRLTLLHPMFIADYIEILPESNVSKELICRAYKWHLLPKFRQSLLLEEQIKLRSLQDVIIAIGGWSINENVLSVGLYYTGFDDWIYTEWPGPSEYRENFASTVVDEKLLIAGGKLPSGKASSAVDCLDLRTLKWSKLPPMKTRRHTFGMITLNGQVYAAGGSDGVSSLSSMEKWDPLKATWEDMPSMPESNCDLQIGVKGSMLCVSRLGTRVVNNNRTQNCRYLNIYNPLTNVWTKNWLTVGNDLLGMVTVTVNGTDNFMIVQRAEIISVAIKTEAKTTIPLGSENIFNSFSCSSYSNCAVFGNRIIVYGLTAFKTYYPLKNVWAVMPFLKAGMGRVIVISS